MGLGCTLRFCSTASHRNKSPKQDFLCGSFEGNVQITRGILIEWKRFWRDVLRFLNVWSRLDNTQDLKPDLV